MMMMMMVCSVTGDHDYRISWTPLGLSWEMTALTPELLKGLGDLQSSPILSLFRDVLVLPFSAKSRICIQ